MEQRTGLDICTIHRIAATDAYKQCVVDLLFNGSLFAPRPVEKFKTWVERYAKQPEQFGKRMRIRKSDGDLSPVALERNTCLNFANFGAKLTMALQFINCYKPRLVAFLTTLEQSLEEISPKDRPAPEKMGLGGHQRLPFLDVGRPLGTAHRMAAAGVITFLRWRE